MVGAVGVTVDWSWCLTTRQTVHLSLDLRDARQLHLELPDDPIHLGDQQAISLV